MTEQPPLFDPPVRLCCSERHWGAVCPDGLVMCAICFGRFTIDELADEDGEKVDVCVSCMADEQARIPRCVLCGHRRDRWPYHHDGCATIKDVIVQGDVL